MLVTALTHTMGGTRGYEGPTNSYWAGCGMGSSLLGWK